MLLEWDLFACKELTVLKIDQLFIYYYFLLPFMACRILIPSAGTEPGPLAGKSLATEYQGDTDQEI